MTFLWGLTDGSAGMRSQVEGVLEALGRPYALKTARRRAPWAWLPMVCHHGALSQLTPESDALVPPWPRAVVSSGRRAASLALAIKQAARGGVKLIHLTDPRACRGRFDLIVAMEHDSAEGPNVLRTRYALHRLTQTRLQEAAKLWAPRLEAWPKPWTGVLLGGSTHRYTLDAAAMDHVIARLREVLERGPGSLLITPSRRTGEENIRRLLQAFGGNPRVFLHLLEGENPYLGFLALSDALIVTDDSVNMLSEAHFTGKPIYLLPLPGHADTKPARFARRMVEEGVARELRLPLETWKYLVVDERERIVERVREILR